MIKSFIDKLYSQSDIGIQTRAYYLFLINIFTLPLFLFGVCYYCILYNTSTGYIVASCGSLTALFLIITRKYKAAAYISHFLWFAALVVGYLLKVFFAEWQTIPFPMFSIFVPIFIIICMLFVGYIVTLIYSGLILGLLAFIYLIPVGSINKLIFFHNAISIIFTYILALVINSLFNKYIQAINEKENELIHDREQAEHKLDEVQNIYQLIIENMHDGIIVFDKEGKVTYANDKAGLILGYEKNDLPGDECKSFEEIKVRHTGLFSGMDIKSDTTAGFAELDYTRNDGINLTLNRALYPIYNNKGTFIGSVIILQDISEQKRAELVLQKDNARLNALLKNSSDIVTIADESGNVIYRSPNDERILGRTRDELNGMRESFKHIYEEDRDYAREAFKRALQEPEIIHTAQYRIAKKDGSFIWFEAIGSNQLNNPLINGIVITSRDITERKEAQDRILQTNRILQRMLDNYNSRILIALLDRDFNFISVNKSYAWADEKEPEFFTGKNHFDLYPDEGNMAIFKEVVETGEPFFVAAKPFEYAANPERGTTYWDWSLDPIIGTDGDVEMLVFTLLDVTEMKKTELALEHYNKNLEETVQSRTRELKESEIKFRTIADYTNDWEYWLNPELEFIYISPSCERITGYSPEDFYKNKDLLLDIIHPDDREKFRKHLMRFDGNYLYHEMVYRIIKKDKTIVYIGHECQPVHGDDNQFLGRRGSNRDITAMKNYEAKLAEGESVARALINSTNSVVMIIDRDGIILEINKEALDQNKKKREEYIGVSLFSIIGNEMAASLKEKSEKVIKTGESLHYEEEFDGRVYDTKMYPVQDHNGPVSRIVIFSHDLTEKRRMQKEIMTIGEIERQNMGHYLHDELGQILTGAGFLIETILHKNDEADRDEIKKTLNEVAKLVGGSIVKIRDISRRLQPVEIEKKGLKRSLEDLADEVSRILGIECSVHWNGSVEIEDKDIATQLYYIAREALNNAFKHGRADSINIIMNGNGESYSLDILDNGSPKADSEDKGQGMGQNIMLYRANSIKAHLIMEQQKDGYLVSVSNMNKNFSIN